MKRKTEQGRAIVGMEEVKFYIIDKNVVIVLLLIFCCDVRWMLGFW